MIGCFSSTAELLVFCFRLNGSSGGANSRRVDPVKKSVHGAAGTSASERPRHVGVSAANIDTGSELESTSMCDSDDDDDDCSSRLSSTATEQSDVQYMRRRRHKHQHRRRPAVVSYLLNYLLTLGFLWPVQFR